MLVLKPLALALADHDRIYALIRASGVNQDGRTPGMTVPSLESQAALVRDCCRLAGIQPGAIQYVEAHGTGTLVGDPIEARALGTELLAGRPAGNCCLVGSVKTNIGHLEPASGIAGLIKVALALKHRQIPANLHFNEPNPDIPFEALRLRVPRTLEPWPASDGPALAGINSFGFGGTNAHAILQEPPAEADRAARRHPDKASTHGARNGAHTVSPGHSITAVPLPPAAPPSCYLLPLSARSPAALKALAGAYCNLLAAEGNPVSLPDLCYNASLRRGHHSHRLALVAHSREELLQELDAFVAGESHPAAVSGQVPKGERPALAFVCAGQGPQWWAMGRQLLTQEPVFRRVIEACDALVRKLGNWSLLAELTAEESVSRLQETAIAQPAIFAVQAGLAELWRSWGILPDAVVGHSVGEVAAGYIAGVLSLEDAVRVIFHRGRCMDFAPGQGKMLAVGLPVAEARRLIGPHADRVGIAAINGPASVTLSGEGAALEAVAAKLEPQDVFCRFLKVQYAFHSYQMDPVKEPLLESLADLSPGSAQIPLYSTVTGQRVAGPEWSADYWWQNVRQPVRFTEAVDRLLEANHLTFVELSPHPVLTAGVSECLAHRGLKGKVLHSLRRGDEERATLLRALGTLYALGYSLAWDHLAPTTGRFVRLPAYPWEHDHYWYEPEEGREMRLPTFRHPLLGRALPAPTPSWENKLDLRRFPALADHRVRGHIVLPGTAYLEMGLAVGKEAVEGGCSVLEEVQMVKACFLPEGQAQTLQTVFNPADSTFTVFSRPQGSNAAWTTHAKGVLRARPLEAPADVCLEKIKARCPVALDRESCYARFANVGLEYGPAFQGLQRLYQGCDEALGQIEAPAAVLAEADEYRVHPAILDACVQSIFGLPSLWGREGDNRGVYLPVEAEQVRVYGNLVGAVWCHVRLVEQHRDGVVTHLRVLSEDGNPLVEVRGLRCQSVGDSGSRAETLADLLYEYRWLLQPRPGQEEARESSGLPVPREVAQSVQAEARRLSEQQRVKERYDQLEPGRNALCTGLIWKALEQLGADLRPGQRFTAKELPVAVQHQRLLARFLAILEIDGLLRQPQDGLASWEVVRGPKRSDTEVLWRELVAEFPAFIAELILLGRCGRQLAGVLRGDVNPAQLIFSEGGLTTAEHYYQDSPCYRFSHSVAQSVVARLVERFPEGRPLRVLEIGAGTGGLTSYLLPLLPVGRTTYVFTDSFPQVFNKAEQKFRDCKFVQYQRLDIENNPAEQGFEQHSFDLVVGSQALHATADLGRALEHVGLLLAPAGLLLLVECVEPPRWLDLVIGPLEGWWRFTDVSLRPSHALLPFSSWQRVLEEAGFSHTMDLSLQPLESAVILARGPECPAASSPGQEGRSAPALARPATPGRWLLFADRAGVGEKLAELLTAQGEGCTVVCAGNQFVQDAESRFSVAPGNPAEMRLLLEQLLHSEGPAWRGLVHLWNLDAPTAEAATDDALLAATTAGGLSIVHLLQAWTELAGTQAPRLYLVTGGVFTVGAPDEPISLAQAPLWGLGRVVGNEFQQLRCKLVDLSADRSDTEVGSLFEELWVDDREDEVALRATSRFVHRYVRRPSDRPVRTGRNPEVSYRLEVSRSGTIDGLKLRAVPRRPPGPGEIELRVMAAALNFSDVMKALGLYPGLPDGPVPLGLECSGTIAALGAGVEGFRVGDAVVAIAPFSFSAYLTIPALMVAPKPAHLTFEEATTIPIAFLTADYALNAMGRMEPGERVLVHSATGGVGLAALQLVRKGGAEAFATAGSREKREFLQALGVEHVMDSRSVAFADEVRERTSGRGVDLVLNSLAGEAIGKGLASLADHGRFLEIGKRDIYQNSRLGLLPFRKNLSFLAIDLDRGLRERPARFSALFRDLAREVERRALAPLPHRVFPISNAAGAFRLMAQGKHLGKVVLSFQDQTAAVAPGSEETLRFRADGTYLITGGVGGFGLSVAQWLVEHGARHLVLVSRRGVPAPDGQQAVDALEKAGARVLIARVDVSKADAVAALLSDIAQSMPPLRGVFHAAMVLDDCLVLNLNRERWQRVLEPKLSGAWNLHSQTQHLPLDCFVLFSTMSCVFGIAGQANYGAANSFLDALAHYRRARGLPALAVNWGYLGDVGYVARNAKIGEGFKQLGVSSFSSEEALALLGRLLQEDACQSGVIRVNWSQQRKGFRGEVPAKFAQLSDEAGGETAVATSESATALKGLRTATPDQRRGLLLSLLRDKVAGVLGSAASRLDPDKSLMELGLDSLMAVELRNWVEGELRLTLPIVELMRGPSVTRLVEILLEQLSQAEAPAAEPAPAVPTPAPEAEPAEYPLSANQRSLWFTHRMAPESSAYNIVDALRLHGPLDVAALTRALQSLVDRHPALRTTFHEVDGRPVQSVRASLTVPLETNDASGWTEDEMRSRLQAEIHTPFDLERGPTSRALLFRRGPDEHILVFLLHHLVADLWSVVLCSREFLILYDAEKSGQAGALPPPATTYAGFVRWQTESLAGVEGERARTYWTGQLAGDLPVLNLPTDHPRPAAQTYRGAWQSRTLSPELTQRLKALGEAHGSTLFMTLLAAYQVLLHRYTAQEDILVGCPTTGRSRAEFAQVAGYFVNPVVLRGNLAGNPSFLELLARTRATTLATFEHQDFPFGLLVEELQPRRDPARTPIFQTMFTLQKAHLMHEAGWTNLLMEQSTSRIALADLEAEAFDLDQHDAQFELSLQMAEVEGGLMSAMQYNTDLFEPETITRWLGHFQTLLEGIVADPARPLGDLPLLPRDEQQRVRDEWSRGQQADFPQDQCLHRLFEARVAADPEAIAVIGECLGVHGRVAPSLTYAELNRRANRLAHRLRSLGVGPDMLVGLCLERSPEMIVGMLGILKAGGAYLPLDPEYPSERLTLMLEDARVPVLVTQQALVTRLEGLVPHRICLDTDALDGEPAENPTLVGGPESLAYAIYTSGSTGRPRGVLVQQRAVVNHNIDFLRRYGLRPGDRVLQFASISFDTAAEEIFPTLLSGATLVLRTPQATASLTDFLAWLDRMEVTVVDLPTAYWHFWVSELARTELPWPQALRWVIVGGEKVLPDRLATWQRLVGDRVNWSNGYGPTEITIQATTFSLISRPETARAPAEDLPEMRPASELKPELAPIGRPIANVSVYVLDGRQQPVPVGVPGEMYVGGIGLARGYLNQPELTASQFVTLVVRPGQQERLYRTGDLARWLPDGNLEYLGRLDHQVKIRGYRIELAEIEARMSEHPGVAENVVLAREDVPGERRLAAYVVGKPGQTLTPAGLRDYLKQRLPGYMVPSAFVLLPALPLTPNGKLDRNALPAPAATGNEREYVAPRTPQEQALATVWEEVLDIPRVGVTDNFFELGSDSIQALQMISRARQAGLHLTPRQIYQHQTIADLVAALEGTPPPAPSAPDSETEPIPLTPLQHWFFEQDLSELHGWSQALPLEVEQLPDPVLVETLCRLIATRHDALRLRFQRGGGGWTQTLAPVEGAIPCRRIDLSRVPEAEQESALAAAVEGLRLSLNVTTGPLASVALVERGHGRPGRLLLAIHHLVMDSVSWRVLLQDFEKALGQLWHGQAVALPPAPTSFRRYARHLAELARTPPLREASAFWIEEGGKARAVALPTDREGVNSRASADSVWMALDEGATQALLAQTGPASAIPTQAALTAALARVLGRWSGISALLLDLEGHGRDGLGTDLDLSQTVGWLASIHPLWLEWPPAASTREVLHEAVRRLRETPHKGVSYGLVRYLGDAETVAALRSPPKAAVRLNYIGQLDALPAVAQSVAPLHRGTEHLHQIEGKRRYLLECNGHVADGRLWLGLTYSTNLHERGTIDRLAVEMLAELRDLCACLA
jgi:amino acid adenylation domain-containing protein/non-ribosomal peptide synthase protein (TIGR01720 family)